MFAEFGDDKASICIEEVKIRDADYLKDMLQESARGGQLNIANALLASNANVNAVDCRRNTALIISADAGHADCVKLLLEASSDFTQCSWEGTALIVSAKAGHADCVKLLLEASSDVKQRNDYDDTALIISAKSGHADCVKLLLDAASDINTKTFCKRTPLLVAAKYSNAHKGIIQ